jgi:hypothetical protein
MLTHFQSYKREPLRDAIQNNYNKGHKSDTRMTHGKDDPDIFLRLPRGAPQGEKVFVRLHKGVCVNACYAACNVCSKSKNVKLSS